MPRHDLPTSPDGLAPRGVYREKYIGRSGERYIVAVDRDGLRRMEVTLYPTLHPEPTDVPAVIAFLWERLELEDPPHLTLLP